MSGFTKMLHVRVTDLNTGERKVNVNIPVSLANFGMKMAAKYSPESIDGLNMDEIIEAAKNGVDGKLVEVEDLEKGELVEIFVE